MKSDNIIIIFGCSKLGEEIYEKIKEMGIQLPVYFMDNDGERQKNGFEGQKVLGVEEAQKFKDNSYYIIASYQYHNEMVEQLRNNNIEESRIIIPEKIWKNELRKAKDKIDRRIPHKTLNFAVDLAEHCNLNCRNCDHFSPLAREHFTDVREYEKDLKRIRELFGDRVSQIDLEGGEPLLNPDIEAFLEITYHYFPKALINIFTNGLLLIKMTEHFWELCAQYGIELEVTKYPIAFDYDKVLAISKEKGVRLHYYNGDKIVKTSRHQPLDLEGKQDKWESFCNCFLANKCIMLKKGRLYTCTVIPNIEHFNRFFNQHVEVTEKDSIDIYSDVTAEDILEFLCEPVPACRYCKVMERTGKHVWRQSRKEIGEWT